MKTILKITLLLFVLNAFQSCSKDDAPAPEPIAQSEPEPTPEPKSEPEPEVEPEIQNNALSFDGVDDYVNLDTLARALSLRKEITVEFWVKTTVEDNAETVRPAMFAINPASPGENKVLIVLGSQETEEQTGQLTIYEQGSPDKVLTSETRIDDGLCHHIAYVRTQTQVEAFLDGESMGTFEISVPLQASDRISLGQEWDQDLKTGFFKGTIDELRVWRYARTKEEVKANMNSELAEISEDLLAYYTFNQGAAEEDNTLSSLLLDATPSKYNGDLIDFELNGMESNYISGECISTSTN